ncbi:MAG: LrgB family protein [Reyranellaceae bacterium]
MNPPFALWVYLAASPLLWLTLTVGVYVAADLVAQTCRRHPLVNPVLLSIVAIAALLLGTGTPYATYFDGAQFVYFLLGPATVAIAVPLYKNWPTVRRNALPMLAALLAGSLVAIVSALGIAAAFGVPRDVLVSLAPKSVTAAVAMSIAEHLGGVPALTAVLVTLTGVLGSVVVTPLMNALGIRDYAARGFAVGVAAHGIGAARAFVVDPLAGTFAGIALGLNAVLSSLLVPVVVRLLL